MRILFAFVFLLCFSSIGYTQTTAFVVANKDTIMLGNFMIINTDSVYHKKGWYSRIDDGEYHGIKFKYKKERQTGDFETRWLTFDIGFANYIDQTNYKLNTHLTNPPIGLPLNKDKLKLRNTTSLNLNIWFVQQKVKLTKDAKWSLKYGLGLEAYNLNFDNSIDFRKGTDMYISLNKNTYEKNKLSLGYLTVPLIVTNNFKFKKVKNMSIGGGLTFGYLVRAKNKQIDAVFGKKKYNADFNLNDYRIGATVEVGFGALRFYGSTSITNLLDRSITNQSFYPFAFGIRL